MITLITGGVKSGKSRRALELTKSWQFPITFVATASTLDAEMEDRVAKHQIERAKFCLDRGGLGICGHSICSGIKCNDNGFNTIEEQVEIDAAAQKGSSKMILDCIVMWVNNLLYHKREADFDLILDRFLLEIKNKDDVVIVSNETNLGNIPFDPYTRQFNMLLATANRRIAEAADKVELIVCGIPLVIKGHL
ncbi:MAG: bifunctional adenosylcobinamide kinase/adenosylcobinamide-phosphate guanylyltransferase [Termitinemataceae bacterium]|nr:MAG: bifunctional adenosylcobinamide kinase/adenosylcobinamide-phosphate guanylyltransferase [Termitinemataceae bacterium]